MVGVRIYTFKWPSYLSAFFVGLLVFYLGYTYQIGLKQAQVYPVVSWQVINQKIVIDPGHGGVDPGAQGPGGTLEKDVNLAISMHLAEYLRQAGADVVMVREDDRDLSHSEHGYSKRKREDLIARVQLVNDVEPIILVSIHANSFPSDQWSGAQTFYRAGSEEGEKLAKAIQKSLTNIMGNTDRKAKSIDSYLLNNIAATGVLVEVGFLSNPQEEKKLADEAYQKKLAWAIFNGIANFINQTNQ